MERTAAGVAGYRAMMRSRVILLLLVAPLLWGCPPNYVKEDRTDRRPRELAVTDAVGGAHWRVVSAGPVCYEAFNDRVLAVATADGKVLDELRVLPLGHCGAVVDLCLHRGDLYAAIDGSAVARIDISDPRDLSVIELADAARLGVQPERLSSVGGELWISGNGGVVRARDSARHFSTAASAGRVVMTHLGPAVPIGRTVRALEGEVFLGTATELVAAPDWVGIHGGFAFVLQSSTSARVGLLGSDLREVSSTAVDGTVTEVFLGEGRLWAVTTAEIFSWPIKDGKLGELEAIAVKGAIDGAAIRPNYLAVCGTFGRALYRIRPDSNGPGDEFLAVKREPGRVDVALGDRRRVLVGSPEGVWEYIAGDECKLTTRELRLASIGRTEVEGAWGRAHIASENDKQANAPSGESVIVEAGGEPLVVRIAGDPTVRVLEAVDGELWIGHDKGIVVVRPSGGACPVVGSLRIPGPVTHIFPKLVGGGATYVTALGGLGVAEWKAVDEKPQP